MLLNDIGKLPDTAFRKINQHLETNYGFKIAENASDRDLVSIMEQIEGEIIDLKVKGDDAHGSSEISKRLLILEGLKTLREYAIIQFQSHRLEPLLAEMIDAIVDHFTKGGTNMADFDSAIEHTMREYRKSDYDFPNDYVENRIRSGAMARLQKDALTSTTTPELPVMEDRMGDFGAVGKRASALGGHPGAVPDTAQGKYAMKALDNPALSLSQQDKEETIPMIRDKNGRMVPDPFKAHAAERRKGITTMHEHKNLVKSLRRLLETEVSQAEVMMAAKGFAQELQEMVEKIGRLQNEDLPPVTDQMRETYGMESASAFQTQIYGALQSVMDSLYTAKGQVDDAVSNMASTGQVTAQVDMDKDIDGMGDGMGDGMDVDANAGMDADLDNIEGELDAEDEFGAENGEAPLGREMKAESLQRKVAEMSLLVEKVKKLRKVKG